MQTDFILSNISKHISLSSEETNYFLSLLQSKTITKRDFLLKTDEPCNTFNYVISGALRAFYRDASDKESTIMFAVADWWITDMPSFVHRTPATISIEAITESEVLQISYENMESLYRTVPKFERFMRILMQNAYIREQLRVLQNLSLPAETRYQNFLKKYPTIVQQVQQKHIASYLGVTPEFLSAIRKPKKNSLS